MNVNFEGCFLLTILMNLFARGLIVKPIGYSKNRVASLCFN
jgi:hypothetical protein